MLMAVVEPAAVPSGWLPLCRFGDRGPRPRRWHVGSESALSSSQEARPLDLSQTRAVIEQAKGIMMATYRCSADEAFTLLRSASQRANVQVHVLAARLVERATMKSAPPRT